MSVRPAPSVLVVEDDFVLLGIVTAMFERSGLRVHAASSGEAALTLLRERGPEIGWLFTDICLPGIVDGWCVADEYRLSYPDRPIIYASAAGRREHRLLPRSIFVEKPIQPAEILRLAELMMFATLGRVDARAA